jgi:flagellar basal-body rod modification protein FlgD
MVTSTSGTTSNTAANSATSNTSADAASFGGDYNTFLNLLTAQIKNQDPLSPMDTTQWTNQLVQYSSVEQQIKANGYLESIANGTSSANAMTSAVSYIGKTIGTSEDTATLKAGGSATWNYDLGSDATTATLTVKDTNGDTVWSGAADDLTSGSHSFSWDGKDSTGNAVGAGDYTLSISAANSAGTIDASVGLSGTVTSAETEDGSVVLKVGNSSVALDSVTSVS